MKRGQPLDPAVAQIIIGLAIADATRDFSAARDARKRGGGDHGRKAAG